DGTVVALATEPQQLVKYTLVVRNAGVAGVARPASLGAQGAFGGSGESAPIVASAIALTNTTVLVTFADPTSGKLIDMGSGATEPDHYEVSSPDLEVLGAAYAGSGRSRV